MLIGLTTGKRCTGRPALDSLALAGQDENMGYYQFGGTWIKTAKSRVSAGEAHIPASTAATESASEYARECSFEQDGT